MFTRFGNRQIQPLKPATVTDLDAVFQAQRAPDPTAEIVAASACGSLREELEEKVADLLGLDPRCDHFLTGTDRDFARHWRVRGTETQTVDSSSVQIEGMDE